MDEHINHNDEYFFKREIIFSLTKGYLFSFILLFVWFILNSTALWINERQFSFLPLAFERSIFRIEFFIPIFFLGLVVQEVIKSIILRWIAKVRWSAMEAGFSVYSLMPYIVSKYPVNIKPYRLLLIIPSFVLLQLMWLTYCCGYYEWLVYTSLWLFFSGFDILAFLQIKKLPDHYLVAANDKRPGVIIYENPFTNEI